MARVGFCGLGVMGAPMAGHLVSAGHEVTVYNRTSARALEWVAAHGGSAVPTPAEVAAASDIVFVCVGNDDDVRQVILGEGGVLDGAREGLIVVDHTTTSAELAADMATSCAVHGVAFVDAPVSGGQSGAENGVLTVMCGADDETAYADAAVVIEAYSRSCVRLGGSGAGQLAKMVNQICIAGLVQGLSEAIAFGQQAGLDMKLVLEVIGKGAAQSWQMDNRGKTMVDDQYNFGFAVDWMRKDLGLVLDEAKRNGARLPVTALVDQFYADVQQLGGGRWDTSSLIKRLR